MVSVGLVVEGPHDVIMLKPFIEHEVRKAGHDEVRFVELQPTQDETGAYGGGGWSRVLGWCDASKGELISTYFSPLFEDDSACDVIVIHLDGDAVELVEPHTSIATPRTPNTRERIEQLTRVVREALELQPVFESKIVYAFPCLQTEAWVLAAAGSEAFSEIIDAKAALRHAFPRRGKLSEHYLAATRQCMLGIDALPERAESYRHFVDSAKAVVNP